MKQEILLDFVPMLISMIYPKHFLEDLDGIPFHKRDCRELFVSRFDKNFIEQCLIDVQFK